MTNSHLVVRTVVLVAILVSTVLQADTAAYLDPGSGSMLIQGILATIAAGGYVLRTYWTRIRLWMGRSNPAESTKTADDVARMGH